MRSSNNKTVSLRHVCHLLWWVATQSLRWQARRCGDDSTPGVLLKVSFYLLSFLMMLQIRKPNYSLLIKYTVLKQLATTVYRRHRAIQCAF
jgi:hypothetical protein